MWLRQSNVVGCFLLALLSALHVTADETCARHRLIPSPAWVSSGAFSADGETLLVSDPLSQSIFPFSRNGRVENSLPPTLTKTLRDVTPQIIAPQGDKLFVGIPRSRVITLGRGYSVKAGETIQTSGVKKKNDGLTLQGMYLWQPVGSDLLAFSDVQAENERPWSAFVRFPANDPSSFDVLLSTGHLTPSKVFYQLGFPYLASLDEDGFALLFENPIEIYRSRKGVHGLSPLSAFPEGFDHSPTLPTFTAKEDIVPVMAKVEQSKMPVGLYGWERFLYVVVREPEEEGTRWTIVKIDPRQDEVIGSARIPTRANHLTVVPGPKRWAFIEKGSVEAWGRQQIDHVVFVPSAHLRGKMSPKLCDPGELPQ